MSSYFRKVKNSAGISHEETYVWSRDWNLSRKSFSTSPKSPFNPCHYKWIMEVLLTFLSVDLLAIIADNCWAILGDNGATWPYILIDKQRLIGGYLGPCVHASFVLQNSFRSNEFFDKIPFQQSAFSRCRQGEGDLTKVTLSRLFAFDFFCIWRFVSRFPLLRHKCAFHFPAESWKICWACQESSLIQYALSTVVFQYCGHSTARPLGLQKISRGSAEANSAQKYIRFFAGRGNTKERVFERELSSGRAFQLPRPFRHFRPSSLAQKQMHWRYLNLDLGPNFA